MPSGVSSKPAWLPGAPSSWGLRANNARLHRCFVCGKKTSKWAHMGISIPINTIFRGMNIHLPAILMFTRVQGFDPSPYDWIRYLGFGGSLKPQASTKIVRKTLNVVSNNICKDCFCRWCGMWHSVTKIEMFPEQMRKGGVPGSGGSGVSYWVACVSLECSKMFQV